MKSQSVSPLSNEQFLTEFKKYKTWKESERPSSKIAVMGARAEELIIRSHIPYCCRSAAKILGPKASNDEIFEDMILEGMDGLRIALTKFDETKGYTFGTYAYGWVKQRQKLYHKNHVHTGIRIPVHIHADNQAISKATRELFESLGRMPTEEEVAARAEMTVDGVRKIKNFFTDSKVLSLDKPTTEDGQSMLDLAERSYKYEDTTLDDDSSAILSLLCDQYLRTLSDLELKVLSCRFSLFGEEKKTLVALAKELGVSRETVRTLEKTAIKKVKACKNEHDLQTSVRRINSVKAKKQVTAMSKNKRRARKTKDPIGVIEVTKPTVEESPIPTTESKGIYLTKDDMIGMRQDKLMPLRLYIFLALRVEGFTGESKDLNVEKFCEDWVIQAEDLISTIASLSKKGVVEIDVEEITTRAYTRQERMALLDAALEKHVSGK